MSGEDDQSVKSALDLDSCSVFEPLVALNLPAFEAVQMVAQKRTLRQSPLKELTELFSDEAEGPSCLDLRARQTIAEVFSWTLHRMKTFDVFRDANAIFDRTKLDGASPASCQHADDLRQEEHLLFDSC